MNELQDELMTIRLREAETQAEIREIKQRINDLEDKMVEITAREQNKEKKKERN